MVAIVVIGRCMTQSVQTVVSTVKFLLNHPEKNLFTVTIVLVNSVETIIEATEEMTEMTHTEKEDPIVEEENLVNHRVFHIHQEILNK